MKTLYPMDIEEFLMAMGEDNLISNIKKSFNEDSPMPSIYNTAMEYYRKYLVIGDA